LTNTSKYINYADKNWIVPEVQKEIPAGVYPCEYRGRNDT